MDPISAVVLAVVGGAGAVVGLVKLSRWQQAKLTAAWTAAAQRVGGRYLPPGGSWWKRTPDRIEARLGGIDVVVDHYTVSTGKSSATYTRLRAHAPGGEGLGLKLGRAGFFTGMFGGQDLVVDDPVFDEKFRVRAKDSALAVAWLSAIDRMRLLAADPSGFGYELALGGQLKLVAGGLIQDPDAIARAVHAAAELAGGGGALLAAWRRAAEAVGARLVAGAPTFVAGATRLEISGETGVPVVVGFVDGTTRVVAERPRKVAAPAAPPVPDSGFGPASISDDGGTIVVAWPGYVADATRLGHAVKFVRELAQAAPGAGGYRG